MKRQRRRITLDFDVTRRPSQRVPCYWCSWLGIREGGSCRSHDRQTSLVRSWCCPAVRLFWRPDGGCMGRLRRMHTPTETRAKVDRETQAAIETQPGRRSQRDTAINAHADICTCRQTHSQMSRHTDILAPTPKSLHRLAYTHSLPLTHSSTLPLILSSVSL